MPRCLSRLAHATTGAGKRVLGRHGSVDGDLPRRWGYAGEHLTGTAGHETDRQQKEPQP
ncbi:MAG: hypothetical protein IH888_04045 [Planctomycetes bacterium]|nr:hypothetical protein [Planctomycetota bacterium]